MKEIFEKSMVESGRGTFSKKRRENNKMRRKGKRERSREVKLLIQNKRRKKLKTEEEGEKKEERMREKGTLIRFDEICNMYCIPSSVPTVDRLTQLQSFAIEIYVEYQNVDINSSCILSERLPSSDFLFVFRKQLNAKH